MARPSDDSIQTPLERHAPLSLGGYSRQHVTSFRARAGSSPIYEALLRRQLARVSNPQLHANMRAHTPQGQAGVPGSRGPALGSSRLRAGSTGLSRASVSLRDSRAANFRATQPTYNIFTGADTSAQRPPSSRASGDSTKENMAPPDAEEYESQRRCIEELKAEIGTLRYTISTLEQEKILTEARHTSELEEQRRKAQDDFEKMQSAESDKLATARQLESAHAELSEVREAASTDKSTAEKRAREALEEARLLQEQLEDLASTRDEAARVANKKLTDLQLLLDASQRAAHDLEHESQARETVLQQTQAQVAAKDAEIGELEAEVLRLKAQTGDADTMAIIKKELSEQVQHIRTLEATNRDQLAELKHLRQVHKAVEIVEEEKRSLIRKLEVAQSLELQLSEAKMQRQRLEDERLSWAAFLNGLAESDADMRFDSPEAVARALAEERLNAVAHLERIGGLQAELAARESTIKALEHEKAMLKSEVEKAKVSAASSGADKARLRIDRQRALAVKEVEYLRAQLKVFDDEDKTYQPSQFDEQKAKRIQELESLVDEYKAEVQTIRTELESLELSTEGAAPKPALAGSKRSRPDEDVDSEQVGQLARKNRKLQDDLAAVQMAHAVLQKELDVAQSQLTAAQEQNKTRILALRSNPTSDHEAVKLSTLNALKLENEELRKHMQGLPATYTTMPATQLLAAQRDVAEARDETASARKSAQRLKEVWAAKSHEFKEAIFSTLGWTVVFMPNGKMRVESVFYPSKTDEHENSIVFDGEKGTMKVGGGPRSPFAARIADQIKFWVRERGCIPGFLAALTLEFYDEHTRATKE